MVAAMPGVDQLPIDRRLPPDRLETGAVEEGLGQRMAGQGLVEPGDGGRGGGKRAGQHHGIGSGAAGQPVQRRVVEPIGRHQSGRPVGGGSACRNAGCGSTEGTPNISGIYVYLRIHARSVK
jgi:hypothetical protein